jgi:hypothetical protein
VCPGNNESAGKRRSGRARKGSLWLRHCLMAATLIIAHREGNREVIDVCMNQGQRPPFDPRKAVAQFAKTLKLYRLFYMTGD